MKKTLAISLMLALGATACAHNPRPESQEERAEREAQYLQEQQDARKQNQTYRTTARNEQGDEENQNPPRNTDGGNKSQPAPRPSVPRVTVPAINMPTVPTVGSSIPVLR